MQRNVKYKKVNLMRAEEINKNIELTCIAFPVSTQMGSRTVSLSENNTWAESNERH